MKYICLSIGGMETPFLFPDHISHFDAATGLCSRFKDAETVSAGFVRITTRETDGFDCFDCYQPVTTIGVLVSGYSDSLMLQSRPEDADLIQMAIDLPILSAPQT